MRYEKLFQTALEPISIEMGSQVGGYTLIDVLGRGGSGAVWLAVQDHLGREVALKVLGDASPTTNWGGSARRQARFHREVEVASMLDHPNIAHVYDSGFSDGVPYLVMEYIDGQALDDYVNEAKLTEHQIVGLIKTTAEGVQHAHQRGVIHRDLKPSNILVNQEGRPVIVDFGLAKALDTGEIGAASADVSLDGELVGTPAYMAPEQARGQSEALDTRVDVYALGVILYQLLTDELPHDAEGTSIEVLRRISENEIQRPALVKPSLAGDLEALLLKALAKDPEERYASAGDLVDDLGRYLDHQPLRARPANSLYFLAKHLRRHWLTWSAAALSLVIIGAASARYVYDIKAFAKTEQQLRGTLALEASAAEFRNAEVSEETDRTLGILATALEQNPGNQAAATMAGMLLTQTAHLLPLSQLPPHVSAGCQDFRFADAAPVYASHNGRRAAVYSENTFQTLSPFLGHSSPIIHLEIAASGDTLVTMQRSGELSVWSQQSGWQTPTVTETEVARSLRITPNGRWVGWITPDDKVLLWDWQTGEPSGVAPTKSQTLDWKQILEQPCAELLFDPRNRYVLVKQGKHNSTLWNLQSRCLCAVTQDSSSGTNPPAPLYYRFSPDGQRIVAYQPGMPYMFHYQLPFETIEAHLTIPSNSLSNKQGFSGAAFLPTSSSLLVTGSKQVAKVALDSNDFTEMTPEGLRWPRTMAMSSDGRVLAVTGTKASVNLLDLQSGEPIMSIDHSWGVQKLALNAAGTRLALVDGRGKLSVWDSQSRRMLGIVAAQLREMAEGQSLAFSSTGSHIAATTSDGLKHAFRVLYAHIKPRVLSADNPFLAFVLSPDTSKVITSSAKEAILWPTLEGKPLLGPLNHASPGVNPIRQLNFSFRQEATFEPSGDAFYLRKTSQQLQRYLLDGRPSGPGIRLRKPYGTLYATPFDTPVISSVTGGDITVWESVSGSVRWNTSPDGYMVWASLSSKGNYLLTGTSIREVEIWDVSKGTKIHQMVPHHSWLSDAAWSPDESLLATAAHTAEVKLFSTESWRELATFGHQNKVTRVVFHPRDPILLSTAEDGTATLWDVGTFSGFGLSMEHDSPVLHASFSHDGNQIATACQDGLVVLWDMKTQRRLCRPIRHPGAVTKVEFHADGAHIVTLCADGNVRVWPIFIAKSPAPPWFPGLLRGIGGSRKDLASWFLTSAETQNDRFSEVTRQCLQKASTP